MMTGFGGFGLFGPVLMVLFWGGVIALLAWAVGAVFAQRDATTTQLEPSALETLKQRYARGEIDREAFETARKDLV